MTTRAEPTTAARSLRWTFKRDADVVVCELTLNEDFTAYELRMQPPWNPAGISWERFDTAIAAFQRQTTIEKILLNEGWSLEQFERQQSM
jgi:hypothetical protein